MRLSEDQVAQYFEDGYLIVEDVFAADELQPVMDEFEDIVDEWAERLYAAGKIEDKPSYRLNWEEWMTHQAGSIQSYRKLEGDDFEYSAPDAPWLVRWQNYRAASAEN